MTDPTPSTDSWYGILAIILFVVKSAWDIYKERNKPRIDASQVNIADAQTREIEARLRRDLLADVERNNKERDDEIQRLTARISALEKERDEWKIGVGLLLGQLVKARIIPTWIPAGVELPDGLSELQNRSVGAGGLMGGKR